MRTAREAEPLLERMVAMAGTRPTQGSIRPPRVAKQSTQPPPSGYITPPGPPDISCADIPEEQLARTYSQSCIWDPQKNPVPPIQEMQGFGRFRRSVHADADWEISKFRGDLQALGPAVVQHLGDFEIANLTSGVMNHIRTPSYASLASRSGSDSEENSTGPRICRGFDPSKTHLAARSCKGSSDSMSRDGLGAASPGRDEGTSVKFRPQCQRTSFLRAENGQALLATIDETVDKPLKKKAVPLIFDGQGVVDVVIDDDEYESCEESFPPTEILVKRNTQGMTTNPSIWQERKGIIPHVVLPAKHHGMRHYRTVDHVPEKARIGQKKSTKPVPRTLGSHRAKVLVNQGISKENYPEAVTPKQPVHSPAPMPQLLPPEVKPSKLGENPQANLRKELQPATDRSSPRPQCQELL